MKVKILILIFISSFCWTCSDKGLTVEEQQKVDIELIENYLKSKNLTAQKTIDGIYYIINKEGSAEKPKITSEVTVGYKGYFLDEKVFDSSAKTKFFLYNVIQGWQIGIPKFGKGGNGTLLIPSKYGYGTGDVNGRTSAVLVFDIELFDF
jgi:FKBP-type peptidyl-prolyl cis-trans isomerase